LIYVDSSLLLPVYVPEVNSELANSVVKGAEDLLVSDLTVAEFLVGLARKVKLGTLSQELATQVQEHSEAAGQLASTSPLILRALVAIHLAVAVEHKATMATWDGRLSEVARAMGVKILPQNP
jgi:predicted nucleic acid-binding protein